MKTKSLFIILAALLTGMKAMAAVGDVFSITQANYTMKFKVLTEGTTPTAAFTGYTVTSGTVTAVTIPDTQKWSNTGYTYTITEIAENAFENDTKIQYVLLPRNLEKIGRWAFSGCTKIATIVIPATVKSVGYLAFENCTGLQKVFWYLGDDNSSLSLYYSTGYNFFEGCTNLWAFYLYGTRWANITYWPKTPCTNQAYYYVDSSITSLKSNVATYTNSSGTSASNYLSHYKVTPTGPSSDSKKFYSGKKVDYRFLDFNTTTNWQAYKQEENSYNYCQYVEMTSANTTIISANNTNHQFTAYKAGTTTVKVVYHGVTLASAAEVTVNENQCTTITLSETTKTMKVGDLFWLTATVEAEHGVDVTGGALTSSNTSVAKISNGGIYAVGPGTATITYTAGCLSGNNTATCTVTVLENDISNLKFNGGETSVTKCLDNTSSITLTPTFDCGNDVDKTKVGMKWTSDNTSVATTGKNTSKGEDPMKVNLKGAPGVANIKCSHTNSDGTVVEATFQITAFRATVSSMSFDKSSYQVVKGSTANASLNVTADIESNDVKITYSVVDESIAIFADGVLTGVKNGTTTITASHVQNDGTTVTATADIVVADFFINEFKLTPSSSIMSPGQTVTLEPQATGAGDHTLTYKWETSNENVATVDNTGKVTAVNYGSALITATINQTGQTATCRVTVSKPGLIYAGNIFYKMSADGTSLEVTNCAGGVPSDLTADCYEYAGTVFIPETVTHEGTPYAVSAISPFAFYNQVDLQVLSIPVSVKVIDASACEGAKNLARVFFDSKDGGLLRINDRAFYGCKKLNDIDLPNTTTGIYKQAFQDCDALADIVLSTSLTYIDEQAFANCKVLNNLTLPDTKLNINIAAFQNDKALTSITLPALLQGLGASAFEGCTALDEVTFLTAKGHRFTVGVDAFLGTALTKVKIANLDSWIQINFSNPTANPASIAHHIYNMDGEEIINAVVPEGPIAMNNNVFYGCSALKSITLPATLKTVNDNTLNGCTALEHVYVRAAIPPYFAGTDDPTLMSSVFNAAQLDVPAGKNSQYAADGWWGRFKTISGSLTDAQCATPTIAYTGGKLVFNCATAGVTYLYNVAVADAQGGSGNNAAMSTVYTVTVKATKAGMADSDVVTKDINVGGSGSGIKGDINGDGQVTAGDASQILQYVAGKITW